MNIINRYRLDAITMLKLKEDDIIEVRYKDKKSFTKYKVYRIKDCNKDSRAIKTCANHCPYFGICVNIQERVYSVTCEDNNILDIKINGMLVKRRKKSE